jgi:hypothetical protein
MQKIHAKKLLITHFEENIHYKILLSRLREQDFVDEKHLKNNHGGINKELILLTITCFKKFCLRANTNEANKIYDYYIKMEEIIFKYIQDQYNNQNNIILENKQLLELKDKALEEKDQELNKYKNIKYVETEKLKHIYIFSTDIDNVYKIGKTKNNPENRKTKLQTGCVKNIEIIYDYNTSNDSLLESIIHTILGRYQYSEREHFYGNLAYMKLIINITGLFFEILKSSYENITKEELINKIIDKLLNYITPRGS